MEQLEVIKVTTIVQEINNFTRLFINCQAGDQQKNIFALDIECDTRMNAITGQINWSGLPALCQIGYKEDGVVKAWLMPLRMRTILAGLLEFLTHPNNIFVGSLVSHDVKELCERIREEVWGAAN